RAPVPAANGAARDRYAGMMHDTRRVEELLDAESRACRTRACRVVEREQARLELRQAVAAHRAGELVGKDELFATRIVQKSDARDPVGKAQGGFERFRDALTRVGSHFESIDDRFDRMLLLRIQFRRFIELDELAVDPGAYEALPP